MKTLMISLLAFSTLAACVAVPPQTAEEAAAQQAYRDAWIQSRKKAHGSVVPGTALFPIKSSEDEIEKVKEQFPSPTIGDSY